MAGRFLRTLVLVIVVLLALPLAALAAPPPQAAGSGYVVKAGDTLADIAWSLGVPAGDLGRANGITNFSHIYPGQVLTIPGQATGKAATLEQAAPVAPAAQDEAQSAPVSGSKWIDVDLSNQWLTAYRGKTVVYSSAVSTGIDGYNTPTGDFSIMYMLDSQTMSGDDYYLEDVPYVMYFADYLALHGTYWHNNFGTPMSHGCVNLPIPAARWLYDWAGIGTPVTIHY